MPHRLVALVVVVAAHACLVATPARADDAEESRFHDALGHEHYEAHRLEDALREFFEAARLAPSPRITFNIAVCFDLLHQEDDAYLFFREYAGTSDQDPERRRFSSEALARLAERVARVAITSDPPGARLFVDQRDHGSYGQTPRTLALAPGTHTITLEHDGYRSATVEVEARRGEEQSASATLERIVGTLRLSSVPGAIVSVREAGGPTLHEGPAPLEVALPPALYEIEAHADGFRPSTTVARVTAETRTELDVPLDVLPPPTGDLTITSSAAGALIRLDGEPMGFAPTLLTELALGDHTVRLEHAGLSPYEGHVSIEAGARGWLTVTMEEPPTTERSVATWIVGGLGALSLAVGAVFGGLAVANHDAFEQYRGQLAMGHVPTGLNEAELRSQGQAYDVAADTLIAVGVAALVGAVILYFTTEHTDTRESRATFSEGEREAPSP